MRVTVRVFAVLRERAGAGQLELELPDGACVADALAAVGDLAAELPLVMAVNREYADAAHPLSSGDELALIPPVSGGAPSASEGAASGASRDASPGPLGSGGVEVQITPDPISTAALLEAVRDARAGAVVVFEGVTREVQRLEYEAYAEMALQRLGEIATAARARHGLCRAAVAHRVGGVFLSEPSVVVAVSAPHRGEAFAGAREIIDAVKATAPIWKREVDGEVSRWVPGHTPTR